MKHLITLVAIICLIFMPACTQEDPASPSSSEKADMASAYLEIIDNLTELHGEGTIEPHKIESGESLVGLAVVRLIDFDGDGNDELYCAYSKETGSDISIRYYVDTQSIYGFDKEDGLITIMNSQRVSNPSTDVSPSITFQTIDNTTYLVDVYEIANGDYYTVNNGKLVIDYTYTWGWGETQSTLNGEPVSDDELWAAVNERNSQGIEEYIELAYIVDEKVLEKTQQVIEQLRAMAN